MARIRGQKSLICGAHIQNRSSNRQAEGAGVVLLSPKGDTFECMVRLDFPTSNNETEYKALVTGFDLAKAVGAASIVIYYDS